MNVIVGGRGSGKTFRLVEWYKADPANRRIIVDNVIARTFLIAHHGVDARHVFTFSDLRRLRGHHGQFGLDFDVETWLCDALGLDGMHQTLGPVTVNGAAMDAGNGKVVTQAVDSPLIPPRARGEWV